MVTKRYACLCCGFLTLSESPPGTFDICPVCWWEDDDVQAANPDFAGGANTPSLRQARANFGQFGASASEFTDKVRKPMAEETPD